MLNQQDPCGDVILDPEIADTAPTNRQPPPNPNSRWHLLDNKAHHRLAPPALPGPLVNHIFMVSSLWPQMLGEHQLLRSLAQVGCSPPHPQVAVLGGIEAHFLFPDCET